MKFKCYLQCRRQISCFSFFAEFVMLELQCTKITSLELLRTLMALFSATKQKKRKQGHRC